MAIQTDEIKAGIVQYIIDEVPNGLDKATPFLKYVMTDGKKKRDGADFIQFPVKLLANQADNFIDGATATLDLSPSQQLQYGVLDWKFHYFGTAFTLSDYTKAGGETDKIGWIEEKIDGALEDSYNTLSASLHGSNTANSKLFNGLQDIVAASGTSYAGLTDTDYDSDAYLPVITTDTILSYQNVKKIINKVKARQRVMGGKDRVFGLMGTDLYTNYEAIIQNQQLAVNTDSLYSTGFDGFKIGGVEFYLDADCPGSGAGSSDNYLYILPMKYLQFHYVYGLGTKSPFDGETRIPNQVVDSVLHFLAGNLVCNNRRLIGVNKTFEA